MKLKQSHYLIIALIVLMVLVSTEVSAQIPGFEDDVGDEPEAPIHGLVALGLAVGAYLGVKKVKKLL